MILVFGFAPKAVKSHKNLTFQLFSLTVNEDDHHGPL
jgi:hypothetical protein